MVMRKIVILSLLLLCSFGITLKTKACSPVHFTFRESLNRYNPKYDIAVAGYYLSATKFMVTRSSNPLIKVNTEYEVFEYGVTGITCEYISKKQAVIAPDLIGKGKSPVNCV